MIRPRIVLVKPPEVSEFNFGAFSLGVLAAFIRDIAEPIIIDATHSIPSEAAAHIWSLRPDFVGITIMGFGSIKPSLQFMKVLTRHAHADRTKILIGGHGAKGTTMDFLRAGAAAVITGEGEIALRSIIEHGIEPGAPGVACLSKDGLINGKAPRLINPLDELPSPARDLMPSPHDGVHLLETSRGCPHRCAFCETSQFYGNKWRPFSAKRVAAEVGRLVDGYDAWTILFADDNFAASSDRVIDICERLRRGPLPAVFIASVRADDLLRDPNMIPAMASARILRVAVGVETLEPKAASISGKPIHPSVYQEAFARLRVHGIFSVASFIVGLPGQRADVFTSVDMAVKAGPDAAIFVPFIPMPSTPLADGRSEFESDADDKENAEKMTATFFQHAEVRRRLAEAEAAGGIRGLMARSTLSHHMSK